MPISQRRNSTGSKTLPSPSSTRKVSPVVRKAMASPSTAGRNPRGTGVVAGKKQSSAKVYDVAGYKATASKAPATTRSGGSSVARAPSPAGRRHSTTGSLSGDKRNGSVSKPKGIVSL